ncbi:TonB-dependent siderophore receptor [Pararobbsia silviterrae]|uniref:TonB-dependent receptor n=1 Tax=Pararobbsia silviterrae TaxID=1792498 RepID=A0A494XJ15_9BURK|nr:TonB-dependent receptor [Pararobbsia silviterrae]RKP49711.1 TonB-dependent receptor [Pararobbsia silviterrae]
MQDRRPTRTRSPRGPRTLVIHALLAVGVLGSGSAFADVEPTRDAEDDTTTAPAGRAGRPAQTRTVSSGAPPQGTADDDTTRAAHATTPVSGSTEHALPEIAVTGERTHGFAPSAVDTGPYRGVDALDVPATVHVVTGSVIDAQGDTGLYDALRNVAGVTRQQLSGVAYDNLAVRGIPLNNRSSYYFNGVLPITNLVWMPMADKDRVEVLKGASALYYGFATPAGIVNLVTKRPGPKPVTSVSLLGDSNGGYGARADIGRRFGPDDRFGIRINAMDEHAAPPIDHDDGERKFIGAALDWRVDDRLALQYDFEHIDTRIVEQAGIALPPPGKNGRIALPRMPDPSRLLSGADYPTHASADTHLLRADYAVSTNWSINAALGESVTHRDRWNWIFQKYNRQTGAGQVQATQQNGQQYENWTARVETNGLFKTGPLAHDLTIGVSQVSFRQPDFVSYHYTAAQNLYNPVEITTLKPAGAAKPFYAQHVKNSGVYVYDRIALTPRLEFVPGVRRSVYSASQAGAGTSSLGKTTPSASLVFRLTPDTSVYASYIEALESAGNAPATAENAYAILPAVVSTQIETGIRSRLTPGLLASFALFDLRQPAAGPDARNVYVLDGTTRYRGGEFSLQGDVMRYLSLTGALVYLDARQIDSPDTALRGKVPENTARLSATLFADYRMPFAPGLAVNGGLTYIGPRAVNDANQAWIGGYTLYTAGLRYTTRLYGKRATFQANLENASDKRYWSAAGNGLLGVGLGRTLKLASTIAF